MLPHAAVFFQEYSDKRKTHTEKGSSDKSSDSSDMPQQTLRKTRAWQLVSDHRQDTEIPSDRHSDSPHCRLHA